METLSWGLGRGEQGENSSRGGKGKSVQKLDEERFMHLECNTISSWGWKSERQRGKKGRETMHENPDSCVPVLLRGLTGPVSLSAVLALFSPVKVLLSCNYYLTLFSLQ